MRACCCSYQADIFTDKNIRQAREVALSDMMYLDDMLHISTLWSANCHFKHIFTKKPMEQSSGDKFILDYCARLLVYEKKLSISKAMNTFCFFDEC